MARKSDNIDILCNGTAIAIPDTSALLRNRRLLNLLLNKFEQVYIASDVERELSNLKNMRISHNSSLEYRKKKKIASQTMSLIIEYREKYKGRFKSVSSDKFQISIKDGDMSKTDLRIIELAKNLQEKEQRPVFIVHNDKDFPIYANGSVQTLYLSEFMALGECTAKDYRQIIDFDYAYDHIDEYGTMIDSINLDAFLPDGLTLLISCIHCNDPDRIADREGKRVPNELILKKIEFLLRHGADPNKPDIGWYCHTPIEHCITLRENDLSRKIFEILLKYNADYNKCSQDETQERDKRDSEINEGNTPLMIACWHGKIHFVEKLLKFSDLSINQQDCNGFTALHKCAVQRKKQIEKGRKWSYYDKIYNMLINHGIDTRIRDRYNRTAQYYWDAGTAELRGEDAVD